MTLVVINTDALVANASGLKSGPSSPVIQHRGLTFQQLKELRGCVRKVNPNPFPGPLKSWEGAEVRFTLADTRHEVTHFIESITLKDVRDITPADLWGSLAEIAMREMRLTFRKFFQQVHGGENTAMVIRVRPH